MDILSMLGVIIAIVAFIDGNILEGSNTLSLILPAAFLIVIGGTIGAIMIHSTLSTFMNGMRNPISVEGH